MKTNIILICLLLAFAGCTEEKRWGKGELPADYVSFFGDSNAARLNKAQTDMLNRHHAVIHGLDTKDGHQAGLVDYVNMLSARITELESVDPNEVIWRESVDKRLDNLFLWTHNPNALEYRY